MTNPLSTARDEMANAADDIGDVCSLLFYLSQCRDPIEPASIRVLMTALESIEGRLKAATAKIVSAPAIAA